jgi:hypothetical protein
MYHSCGLSVFLLSTSIILPRGAFVETLRGFKPCGLGSGGQNCNLLNLRSSGAGGSSHEDPDPICIILSLGGDTLIHDP